MADSPRPHGRGGFKFRGIVTDHADRCPRPHGRGGFKFREVGHMTLTTFVPAHTGGADLSMLPPQSLKSS